MMSKPKNSFSLLDQEMKKIVKSKKTDYPSRKSMPSTSAPGPSTSRYEKKKTSKNQEKEKELHFNPDIPDRSYGDLYCKICESHMNSSAMWEAHITGKKHLKNVKKGDKDTKYDDLKEESTANSELEKVAAPVIGLSYIWEIRRGPDAPPYYNCFLCSSISSTVALLIEHVLTYKHRTNFMAKQCPNEYQLIEGTNLKKAQLAPLVLEKAIEMEKQFGRGKIIVKTEKPKMSIPPSKRYRSSSEESEDRQKSSKGFRSDKGSVWKSVGSSKMDDMHSKRSYHDRKWESPDFNVRDSYKTIPGRKVSPNQSDYYAKSAPVRDISTDRNDSYRYMPTKRERSPIYDDRSRSKRRERSPTYDDRSLSKRREISPDQNDHHLRNEIQQRLYNLSRPSYSSSEGLHKEQPRPDYNLSRPSYSSTEGLHKEQPRPDYNLSRPSFSSSEDLHKVQERPDYNLSRPSYLLERSLSPACLQHENLPPFSLQHENLPPPEVSQGEIQDIKRFVSEAFHMNYPAFMKIVFARMESEEIDSIQNLSLLKDFVVKGQRILAAKFKEFRPALSQQPQNDLPGSSGTALSQQNNVFVPNTVAAPESNVAAQQNYSRNQFHSIIENLCGIRPQISAPAEQLANRPSTSYQSSSDSTYSNFNNNYANAYPSSYARSQTEIPGLGLNQNENVNPNSARNNYQSIYPSTSSPNENAPYRY